MKALRALMGWIALIPLTLGVGALCVVAVLSARPVEAADPNALWHVVHDLCVTDMKVSGAPAPCVAVDLAKGYAVLKDQRGQTQLLVIPTDRVTGIEDPKLLAPQTPNYWQDAWASRPLFEQRTGRPTPREDVGLAVNSLYGRSQNQLHIHLDCLRADVRDALAANIVRIGPTWAPLGVDLAGRRYRAMSMPGAELASRDPFKLLAGGDPDARADMSRQALAVVGVTLPDGRPGFVLLADKADATRLDNGHIEDILDHDCAVLGGA